ncbi:MAG: iron ABC transporter permease [Candidatus Methanomethylophilaceae archaeon]|nr:iron ABC transporter permease [Candidatus Methanomethylophilaceae archaeon]
MIEDAVLRLQRRNAKWGLTLLVLFVLLFISVYFSVSTGRIQMTFLEFFEALIGRGTSTNELVIWQLRLPRTVMAILVGAGLTVAGVGMQAVFKNPMASPYVLGLSSGAAFGAALAIVLGITVVPGSLSTTVMAFVFCFLTLMIVYNIARSHGRVPIETLLLAGIAVGAFFSALVNLLTYVAEDDKLAGIVYWMMGDLSQLNWDNVLIVLPLMAIGICVVYYYARDLNAMMLGDNHAMNLGIEVGKIRLIILLACALLTAAAVSFVGIIGFVGLVIPHVVRMITGPDHRILIPASILAGSLFLVVCDILSRVVFTFVLPIGILTALIGAPYFIYLLRRRRREIGW